MKHKGQSKVSEHLGEQMSQMKKEGYTVFPASIIDGSELYNDYHALNFAPSSSSANVLAITPPPGPKPIAPSSPFLSGGFTSSGIEMPVKDCGAEGLGYMTWGANDKLPNIVALANASLPYTAAAIKFNVDTACGLGVRAMYKMFSGVAGQMAEVKIPYEQAGQVIRSKILAKQKELMNLLSERQNVTDVNVSDDESIPSPYTTTIQLLSLAPTLPQEQGNEKNAETSRYPHREAGQNYYKSMSCDMLDEIIATIRAEIADLKTDLGIWKKTNGAVKRFQESNSSHFLTHSLFNDLISFGICFPEIRLSQNASKQKRNANWRPVIERICYRNALTCRLERLSEDNVSRHVYVSNSWLDPTYYNKVADLRIGALPAIDPTCPKADLLAYLRDFRNESARREAEQQKETSDVSERPCRFIMPVSYSTPGRVYYPIPSYWSIYNDIYQYASTIIRDRAIRKANESMFGYVVYVHSDYLDKLVSQMNAKSSQEEVAAIKQAEITKIKQFLANKRNNGQAFAACTFTGSDGKDHDAFRIEQVSMANKNAAEADKTEIADISSIILFAMECHPDLIGSTPGGASSKGGTYQREMLQIKQTKLSTTQSLVLEVYNLVRDFNEWDANHLEWTIVQRTLTTLDRSHSGTIDE